MESIKHFFVKLKDVYDKHDLHNKPASIYNLDETGLTTDQNLKNSFFKKGVKNTAYEIPNAGKSMYTLLMCGNGAGTFLPSFIVYRGKHLHETWCTGGPAGTYFGVSKNLWMTEENFRVWFQAT